MHALSHLQYYFSCHLCPVAFSLQLNLSSVPSGPSVGPYVCFSSVYCSITALCAASLLIYCLRLFAWSVHSSTRGSKVRDLHKLCQRSEPLLAAAVNKVALATAGGCGGTSRDVREVLVPPPLAGSGPTSCQMACVWKGLRLMAPRALQGLVCTSQQNTCCRTEGTLQLRALGPPHVAGVHGKECRADVMRPGGKSAKT